MVSRTSTPLWPPKTRNRPDLLRTSSVEGKGSGAGSVPLIGPMIKALIKKKMEQNLDSTMQAIKRQAESVS